MTGFRRGLALTRLQQRYAPPGRADSARATGGSVRDYHPVSLFIPEASRAAYKPTTLNDVERVMAIDGGAGRPGTTKIFIGIIQSYVQRLVKCSIIEVFNYKSSVVKVFFQVAQIMIINRHPTCFGEQVPVNELRPNEIVFSALV